MPADAAPSFLYVAELPAAGATLRLAPEESRYLARVCRARAGERARATDGHGGLALLRLLDLRGVVTAEVESVDHQTPGRTAHVLCGAPAAERGDWLIEKLAELGVTRFQPVDCTRAAWRHAAGRAARWRRLAVAALRQSQRRWLMEVAGPLGLEAALAALPAGAACWQGDPGGRAAGEVTAPRTGVAAGAIGPAGGFEGRERALLEKDGFEPLRLSAGRLRTETAALCWACWWSAASPAGPDQGGPPRSGGGAGL